MNKVNCHLRNHWATLYMRADCVTEPAGRGIYTWSDGSKHEGTWKKGKRHGKFIYTDGKGGIRHEVWDNDMLIELP